MQERHTRHWKAIFRELNSPSFLNGSCKGVSLNGAEFGFKCIIDPSKNDNFAIIEASRLGRTEIVELLLKDPRVNPCARNNQALCVAKRRGSLISLIQDPRVDPGAYDNIAIKYMVMNQKVGLARILMRDSRVDPSVDDNYLFYASIALQNLKISADLLAHERCWGIDLNKARGLCLLHGNFELLDILPKTNMRFEKRADEDLASYAIRISSLPLLSKLISDDYFPKGFGASYLTQAIQVGNVHIVGILLMSSDVEPSANDNEPIRVATKLGRTEIANLILNHPRFNNSI